MNNERKFIETFTHPKTKYLSIDIYEYFDGRVWEGEVLRFAGDNNCCDGWNTLEQARENCLEVLQSYYDGSYYDDGAKEDRYAQQERWATGGGDN